MPVRAKKTAIPAGKTADSGAVHQGVAEPHQPLPSWRAAASHQHHPGQRKTAVQMNIGRFWHRFKRGVHICHRGQSAKQQCRHPGRESPRQTTGAPDKPTPDDRCMMQHVSERSQVGVRALKQGCQADVWQKTPAGLERLSKKSSAVTNSGTWNALMICGWQRNRTLQARCRSVPAGKSRA